MRIFFVTIGFALLTQVAFATEVPDSLRACFDMLEAANATMQSLQRENQNLKADVVNLNSTISDQTKKIDSLKTIISETNNSVAVLADSLNINISTTKAQLQTSSDTLKADIDKKSNTGMWIFIALGLVVGVIAVVFGKLLARRGNEVASLSAKADKLNEEIVNRLSSEMAEMQTLSRQIGAISNATGSNSDTEQKLIITLADRITFMEMTLYKMDSSVRGHKQLSKSIKQMKDNLLANGYELVDMLGKDYHEGMRVIANFVEDENLPAGKQVITGIIKPQINFNGKMIQSAQIQVSQNI